MEKKDSFKNMDLIDLEEKIEVAMANNRTSEVLSLLAVLNDKSIKQEKRKTNTFKI